ncbi:MAG: class I tRNA ligase family protein, partial [Chloroflexi bacterium]|nr:class I tRNA ligase family protein [Chloroflexota bacterium]
KMSKSKGNVVDPWSVMDVHGADALRWYLITAAPPYIPRRFSAELVGEALRKFMLTLWNTYSFFVIYANLDGWTPATATGRTHTRVSGDGATGRDEIELSLLDRWILSELHRTVREVRRLLDDYDPTGAGRAVESFVDDLSNWYVRRGRRRFWKSESDADKAAAYATLHECLVTVAKLIAPMTPFLAEELYQNLVSSHDKSAPDSVHLCDFPEPDESLIDEELSRGTRLVMRVVSLGRAARSKAAVKVRQPLGEVVVCLADSGDRGLVERLGQQVLDELNVEGLQFADQAADLLSYSVRPNLKVLGPRLGKQLNDLRQALPAVDGAAFLRAQRTNTPVEVAGITLAPEEYEVLAKEREGYSVAEESGYVVALKTEITPDLLEKGLAREIVHRIQNLRKSASFRIEDRIVTYFDGDADLTAAIERFADTIKAETLSDALQRGPAPDTAYSESQKVEGKDLTLAVERR